jgi:hypothetical protein
MTRPVHTWRLPPILPTISSPVSSTLFWPPSHNPQNKFALPGLQTYAPPSPAPFRVRLRPIKPLLSSPAPLCQGSLVLRTFLYARKKWPLQPFRQVAAQALEAVRDSQRVDGLPRVVFVVSSEVEKPLRGRMHGVIRHRFKRRMKAAFRIALEEKRKEDKGIHCHPYPVDPSVYLSFLFYSPLLISILSSISPIDSLSIPSLYPLLLLFSILPFFYIQY